MRIEEKTVFTFSENEFEMLQALFRKMKTMCENRLVCDGCPFKNSTNCIDSTVSDGILSFLSSNNVMVRD